MYVCRTILNTGSYVCTYERNIFNQSKAHLLPSHQNAPTMLMLQSITDNASLQHHESATYLINDNMINLDSYSMLRSRFYGV